MKKDGEKVKKEDLIELTETITESIDKLSVEIKKEINDLESVLTKPLDQLRVEIAELKDRLKSMESVIEVAPTRRELETFKKQIDSMK